MLQARFEALLQGDAYSAAWRYCWRLCGETEAARDLLQESLAHAYRKFPQLRNPDKFRGWLLNIVRTQYLMQLRRERRQPRITESRDNEAENSTAVGESNGMPRDVAEALATLPRLQREALELHYFDGLEVTEAALVLGIRANAVKARLFRGRESLRKLLGIPAEVSGLQGVATDE